MKGPKKSIRYSIIVAALSVLVLLGLGYGFITTAQRGLRDEKVTYLKEISLKSAALVKEQINGYLDTIEALSTVLGEEETFDPKVALKQVEAQMDQNSFKRMGVIMPDGTAYTTDKKSFNFSDRTYFRQSMDGKSVASDCLIDKTDGKEINVFSTPIFHQGEIVGVLFATKTQQQLSEALTIESFHGESYAYIINSDGRPVVKTTHPGSVGNYENLFDILRQQQVDLAMREKLAYDVTHGITDSVEYVRDGIKRQLCYAPVGINDWYILSAVPSSVISAQSDRLIFNLVLVTMMMVLLSILISARMIRFFQKNNRTLASIAYTDPMTGYANWAKFKLNAEQILAEKLHQCYAIVAFDINKFKAINDMLGYQQGNEILKFTADTLAKRMKEQETFARASADNFDLLLRYSTEEELLLRLDDIANELEGHVENYKIGISAGIYVISEEGTDVAAFCDNANLSRNIAKKKNDCYYHFFRDENRQEIIHEKEIENIMDAALAQGEFELYLQPKYRCDNDTIIGAEALVRWNRGEDGLMQPGDFIPIFEKNGFIRKLDIYMFQQSCALLARWKKVLPDSSPIPISVNLSRIHLSNRTLPQELLRITRQYGVNPSLLEIELTESTIFQDLEEMIAIMKRIKAAGFLLSIDDFGSGYSSLASLKYIPADFVKMDKSFLDEAENDKRSEHIIRSIINMVQSLGMRAVAEGVETRTQLDFLKNAGCDIVQGYYWSRPVPIKDFEELAHKHKKMVSLQ